MIDNYGDNFQEKSRYDRGKLPQHYLDWDNKPPTYKVYENALKIVNLPDPDLNKNIDFWEVVKTRRSTRRFLNMPLQLKQVSNLLFGTTGITRNNPNYAFRVNPSAGGLYPIETYIAVNNVEDLEQGIYHYKILSHKLELLKQGDFRLQVAKACLDQKIAYDSAINFIWSAVVERSKWKYLQRCYRYLYLDCGHIAQNLYLVAGALNLSVCTIGAIYDDELNTILGIDGVKEFSLYVGVVGHKFKNE